MTDASTKGLFPQLTDVLYALTESHAMLLRKVQGLRLEHTDATHFVLNDAAKSANTLNGKPGATRSPELVEVSVSPTLDRSTTAPIDETEPTALTIGSPGDLLHPVTAKSDVEMQGADGQDIPLRSSVSEGEPTQGEMSAMGSARTADRRDGRDRPEAAEPQPTGAESDGRNYNFFDELDARLAGLEDQDPGQ